MLKARKLLPIFGIGMGFMLMCVLIWFGYGGVTNNAIVFEGSTLDWYWVIILLVFWLILFLVSSILSLKKESQALYDIVSYVCQKHDLDFENVLKYCKNTRELLLDYREEIESSKKDVSSPGGACDEVV